MDDDDDRTSVPAECESVLERARRPLTTTALDWVVDSLRHAVPALGLYL